VSFFGVIPCTLKTPTDRRKYFLKIDTCQTFLSETYLYSMQYLNPYEKEESRITELTFNFHRIIPTLYGCFGALLSKASSNPYYAFTVKGHKYNK
jgi:hypothetical protein